MRPELIGSHRAHEDDEHAVRSVRNWRILSPLAMPGKNAPSIGRKQLLKLLRLVMPEMRIVVPLEVLGDERITRLIGNRRYQVLRCTAKVPNREFGLFKMLQSLE